MPPRILVVDDQVDFTFQIKGRLEKEGYEVSVAGSGKDALKRLTEGKFNLILSDMRMPQMEGIEFLKEVKSKYPDTGFIMMTAYGSIETAVETIKRGADDYITKPFSPEELILVIKNLLEKQSLVDEIKVLRKEVEERYNFGNIIGKNYKMQEVYDLIMDVAETDATVLIRGETGTGKELVAKAIHFNSLRKEKVFVSLNCGALPETLLESELFGYERGAFTGAIRQKIGKFEYANGGTLLLDEISELTPATQVKLLRVLQERVFERLGGNQEIRVDVRIIAATNKDLEKEVANGRFREDLYYRLNVVPVRLPPLRERKEDIPPLVRHFLDKYNKMLKKEVTVVSQEVLNELMAYDWPGNVRQLENVIERAIIMAKRGQITNIDLSDDLRKREEKGQANLTDGYSFKEGKRRVIEAYEREYLLNLLMRCKGNLTISSKISGVDIKTLRRKMEEYGLKKEDFKKRPT